MRLIGHLFTLSISEPWFDPQQSSHTVLGPIQLIIQWVPPAFSRR